MNSALKTIKNALEVLPDNVSLEVLEYEWYYDEERSSVYWQGEDTSGCWACRGSVTGDCTEMYGLFMCNMYIEPHRLTTHVFLQEKRLMTNPEEEN
jgi:hypothetical protein